MRLAHIAELHRIAELLVKGELGRHGAGTDSIGSEVDEHARLPCLTFPWPPHGGSRAHSFGAGMAGQAVWSGAAAAHDPKPTFPVCVCNAAAAAFAAGPHAFDHRRPADRPQGSYVYFRSVAVFDTSAP